MGCALLARQSQPITSVGAARGARRAGVLAGADGQGVERRLVAHAGHLGSVLPKAVQRFVIAVKGT